MGKKQVNKKSGKVRSAGALELQEAEIDYVKEVLIRLNRDFTHDELDLLVYLNILFVKTLDAQAQLTGYLSNPVQAIIKVLHPYVSQAFSVKFKNTDTDATDFLLAQFIAIRPLWYIPGTPLAVIFGLSRFLFNAYSITLLRSDLFEDTSPVETWLREIQRIDENLVKDLYHTLRLTETAQNPIFQDQLSVVDKTKH